MISEKVISKIPARFLTLLILGIGVSTYFLMPMRMLPDLPPDTYQIVVRSPGLNPDEFDRIIASELEQSLLLVPCRKSLSTIIAPSMAQFRFVIKDGCHENRESLKGRILEIIETKKVNWPHHTELSQLEFLDPREPWEYLIEGADETDPQIRTWLKYLLQEIRSLEGVKTVEARDSKPIINIDLDLVAMKNMGINPVTVSNLIKAQLNITSLGVSRKSGQTFQFSFRPVMNDRITDLEELVIRSEPKLINLKNIAQIRYELPFNEIQTLLNGRPGIFISIIDTDRADVKNLKSEIAKVIDKHIATYPKPLSYQLLFDQSRFMSDQVESIANNAWLGVITMLIFLGLVMGFRSAFAQLFSTPVIVASTLIVMYLSGQTVNLIAIMGMFIVLGIMIDDSVIVSETYRQWRLQGYEPAAAASHAARSLIPPLITTFIAVTASLIPVFFWSSSLSHFMKPIAIIFIAGLGLSLIECLTLLPAHLKKLDKEFQSEPELREKVWTRIESCYLAVLKRILAWRWLFAPCFLLSILAGAFFAFHKLNFVDHIGYAGERVQFHYQVNDNKHDIIVDFLKTLPDEVNISIHKIGVAERDGKELYGPSFGMFTLTMVANSEKVIQVKQSVSAMVRHRLETLEGLTWFQIEKSHDVAKQEDLLRTPIYITAIDFPQALQIKNQLEKELALLPGFMQLEQPSDQQAEHWQFRPNERKLAEIGISAQNLKSQTGLSLTPQYLGYIPVAGELLDIQLRAQGYDQLGPEELRGKISELEVQHPTHQGLILLRQLGEWTKQLTQTRMTKRNGIPSIKIEATFDQAKMNRQEVFTALDEIAKMPMFQKAGVSIKTNETQENQNEELMIYAAEIGLAAFLVFILVGLTTGSLIRPVLLILGLLPILASVVIALYGHDRSISMLVFVGLLSVFGISLNDGLMILFKLKMQESLGNKLEAISSAVVTKLRAILITGTCAGIGLFPIAYSTDDVNLFVRPIAFGAIWGLFASVVQALFLFPSLLAIEADCRGLIQSIQRKRLQLIQKAKRLRFPENQGRVP